MNFIAGMVTLGYVVAGLFFLKFWERSRDALFVIFAAAFWLLALDEALLSIVALPPAQESWLYVLRLAAFGLIAIAIVNKNLRGRTKRY